MKQYYQAVYQNLRTKYWSFGHRVCKVNSSHSNSHVYQIEMINSHIHKQRIFQCNEIHLNLYLEAIIWILTCILICSETKTPFIIILQFSFTNFILNYFILQIFISSNRRKLIALLKSHTSYVWRISLE